MMRTGLAIAAGLLCGLYGLKTASALREEAARLQRWSEILPALALLIREESVSMPDALRLAADATGSPDMLLQAVADAVTADPLCSLQEAFSSLCAPCREKETLQRMFSRLGRGSAESRSLAAAQAGDAMQLLAAAAAGRAHKDAKLWQTLGLTGGACLTILLL